MKVENGALIEKLLSRTPPGDSAGEWVSRNLRNFLRRGKPFVPLPEALAESLGIDRHTDPQGQDLIRLCEALAAAVEKRHAAKPTRALYVSIPHAVALADLSTRRARNAQAKSQRALLRAAHMLDEPVIVWDEGAPSPIVRRAVVFFGDILSFNIRFSPYGDGRWEQGWTLSESTETLLRSSKLLSGTGWFPRIDKGIREATRQFLETMRPGSLEIHGKDAKRNRHNAATYGSIHPQGYTLERIFDPQGSRSDSAGVSGVRLVRLPAYAPRARRRGRRSEPEWKPTDEAFVIVGQQELGKVLTEGLALGRDYKVALRDRAGAEAYAGMGDGHDFAILRIDLTGLAGCVNPRAPMAKGEWLTLPSAIGDHSFVVGEIPASAITDVTLDPSAVSHAGPR